MSIKQNCFVISPIGDDGSDVRKRADQVLRHILAPVLESCDYEPIRADKISEPGLITSQVIQHIVDDPLVIADLTGMNPNVFYELAIRHAIRKPLVQIIHKGDKIPFDVAGMRTIPVDHHDLDSVEEAKAEIRKQIKIVEGRKPEEIESPISVSVELQTLKQSDRPEDRTLAEIVSAISQLRADVVSLDKKLSDSKGAAGGPPRDTARDNVVENRYRVALMRDIRHMLNEYRHSSSLPSAQASPEYLQQLMNRIDRLAFELENDGRPGTGS